LVCVYVCVFQPWEKEIYWLELRDTLQKKAHHRSQLHRAQIPEAILQKYGTKSRRQESITAIDMTLPPKRERGRRGRASLQHVSTYVNTHFMNQLGFDVEPVTFYRQNDLIAIKYEPPVPSEILQHIDRQLAYPLVSRVIRRRLQRVLQQIPIAVLLSSDSETKTQRLGIVKTMHIEYMVSTIDRSS
jgi:hypothetical protein